MIVLFGASGYTGRLAARALDRRGRPFVAAGRDVTRVREAVAGLGAVEEVVTADATDAASLRDLAARADVLVTTVGPFADLGRPVLEAAVAGGCHYADSSGEQPFLRWAFEQQRGPARAAGVTVIPAAGFDFVPGDLLAAVACAAVEQPVEVHVGYLVRGAGTWGSRGTRRTLAQVVRREVLAYEDGRLVDERLGDARRPLWFPRPVGPRHGVGIPGGEPITVPLHVPTVRRVRTYVAMAGPLADLAQLGLAVLRWRPAAHALERLLGAGPEGPTAEQRERTRWACVAEVTGAAGEVARAWAYGRDVYGFTAEVLAVVAGRLADGAASAAGVVAPAEAFAASDLLDELADTADLRWSVREPEAGR